MKLPFEHSYADLPPRFHARVAPVPVRAPKLIKLNTALAADLGLDADALASPDGVAILSGNARAEGSHPIAQAYAGHQFGGFSPQLGDGRAHLLGEVVTDTGRFDIALKGSGQTPFSRRGDGRAWLGPVLREYIVSEAMAAMGIPTTRALAAVETGQPVIRDRPLPGAILTRVAASHIRVGTFEYFAARHDLDALKTLTDYAMARHDPDAASPLDFLNGVVARQARLIAAWMGVGFIHGVMNTDNCAISGETIDYGPCAFMEGYHPNMVFSSIDQFGRYAYVKQPDMAAWNLAQLASALVPLIDRDEDAAIRAATESIRAFPDLFAREWERVLRAKLGLILVENGDRDLGERLLGLMQLGNVDFTLAFRGLSEGIDVARKLYPDPAGFDAWAADWQARVGRDSADPADLPARLMAANPAFVPRNHLVERAIQAGVAGDYAPFERLLAVTARPFDDQPDATDLMAPATPDEAVRQTFCGT